MKYNQSSNSSDIEIPCFQKKYLKEPQLKKIRAGIVTLPELAPNWVHKKCY
jgi:hypothetical protein